MRTQVKPEKPKIQESGFNKAWREANQVLYVAEAEAHRLGVTPPKAEEVVGHFFTLRANLGSHIDVFHDCLSKELDKLKKEENENE